MIEAGSSDKFREDKKTELQAVRDLFTKLGDTIESHTQNKFHEHLEMGLQRIGSILSTEDKVVEPCLPLLDNAVAVCKKAG